MPQTNVTPSDDLRDEINELADESECTQKNSSKSQLASNEYQDTQMDTLRWTQTETQMDTPEHFRTRLSGPESGVKGLNKMIFLI